MNNQLDSWKFKFDKLLHNARYDLTIRLYEHGHNTSHIVKMKFMNHVLVRLYSLLFKDITVLSYAMARLELERPSL